MRRNSVRRGGPSQFDLSSIPHQAGKGGWSNDGRRIVGFAEQRDSLGARGDTRQYSWLDPHRVQAMPVALERILVLGAPVDVLENSARQPAFGQLAQLRKIQEVVHVTEVIVAKAGLLEALMSSAPP